jgi:hypothetical protein
VTSMYRVHLTSNTNSDWITLIVPLDEKLCVNLEQARDPQPYLFKAVWDGDRFYGEAITRPEEGSTVYLLWSSVDAEVTLTNLSQCPMVIGKWVLIWETEEDTTHPFPYTVRAVQKL